MNETEDSGSVQKDVLKKNFSTLKESSVTFNKFSVDSSPKSETEPRANESLGIKNKESTNFSSLVAAHYNSIESHNFEKRNDSRIVYLRNFNNWIKGILIRESGWEVTDQNRRNLRVLDMCCGKGGDLFKWTKLNVRHMVCADIAENSLEQYKYRYLDYINLCEKNRKYCSLKCEFISADCTRMRLRTKFEDPSIRFDIVSCQFSFHYCFESLPQAECMLQNATECLKPGGLFIGTIPNANEIVKRLKESKSNSFKNDVFGIEMCCSEPYPLFGAKYNFYLEGVVNCPEFLVHFPTFERLAMKYGLKLVQREKFTECFERKRKTFDGEMLLKKMKALETYPPEKDKKSVGPSKDYNHAKLYCELNKGQPVGTLSKSEWDVISLYQTFVFMKEV